MTGIAIGPPASPRMFTSVTSSGRTTGAIIRNMKQRKWAMNSGLRKRFLHIIHENFPTKFSAILAFLFDIYLFY